METSVKKKKLESVEELDNQVKNVRSELKPLINKPISHLNDFERMKLEKLIKQLDEIEVKLLMQGSKIKTTTKKEKERDYVIIREKNGYRIKDKEQEQEQGV